MDGVEPGRGPLALAALVLLAALLIAAIVLDLGPFADEDLSTPDFVGRGDQICKDAHEAFADLQHAPPNTARQAADLNDQLASIAADERDEIAELSEPPELSELVDRYLDAREEGIDALEAGADAARDGDDEAYRAQKQRLATSQAERRRLARRIGFSECSRRLAPS